MKKISLILGCFFLLYAVVLAFLYSAQEKMVFFPSALLPDQDFSFKGVVFFEEFLSLKSGENINYLVFPVENPRGVILYFHGNAGALDTWGYVAAELAYKTQREIWIMDYPGFGKSTGNLARNEKVLVQMGMEFVEKIRLQHPDLPLLLFGRSVGSGIAAGVATEISKKENLKNSLRGVILETPYTTLKSLAKGFYPFVPSFLINFDLDNTQLAKSDVNDVLLIHGTEDEVIPYSHSEYLLEALGSKAQLVSIEGGHHNDLSDHARYWTRLGTYFTDK